MNRLLLIPVIFLLVLSGCDRAQYRTSGRDRVLLPAGDVHEGWYFAGAAQVDVDGTVNGDAFIAGGVVNVRGTINGLLVVAGGQVNVQGTVTDRIVCVGGDLRLSGRSDKSVFAGGGTIVLERGSTVGDYLMAGGGVIDIRGTIARDAKIAGSEIRLAGEVKGNVESAGERFSTEEGSLVGGDLTVTVKDSSGLQIAPGTVHGSVKAKIGKEAPTSHFMGLTVGKLILRILFVLSLLVIVLLGSVLCPRQCAALGSTINGKPGETVLVGLVVLFLTPLVAAVLLLTVAGIPLAVLLMFVYFWFAYLSQAVLGMFLGFRMAGVEGKKGWGLFGPAALGILIVHACALIPFVNVLVLFGGLIVGVGALSLVSYDQFRLMRSREAS